MSIRNRLTLWYGGMLFVSLLFMGTVLRYELVGEHERGLPPESPVQKIGDILLFYGLPTVVVLAVGGAWIIRRTLGPMETLAAAAERVHAGNLGERIPYSGRNDELDRLARIFNEMLARVEAGVSSVREFTLHASHELKTPLTILSAETELALSDPATPPGQRERLASQFEEIQRLAALVDNLGALAKADAGLARLVLAPVQLDELLRSTVEDLRPLAEKEKLSLTLGRCDAASIQGDRAGLRQLLLNLLDNAIKHNQPGGWIRVDLLEGPQAFTIAIENSGEPIPPELLPRVFDRFTRGTERKSGAGLGLSIARTIIEAHGGILTCTNQLRGGIRFEALLPSLR